MENSLVNPSQPVEDSRPLRSSAEGKAARIGHYPFLLRAVGLGIPLILLCAPTVGDLVDLWWTRYGFSHGFLVPLVSLYLAWLQKPALQHIPVAPALGPGLLWLVVATLLLLASQAAGVITTASVALILVLAWLVLLLCGYGYLKALAFPLAYLIFMTPVLDLLTEPLEWPFQLLTASMSVSMLQALGIPVLLENSLYIILPTVTLKVVRECSGAGLLIAVLALGLPLAYLTLQGWWSRITLVVSSVMIAIVAKLGTCDCHGGLRAIGRQESSRPIPYSAGIVCRLGRVCVPVRGGLASGQIGETCSDTCLASGTGILQWIQLSWYGVEPRLVAGEHHDCGGGDLSVLARSRGDGPQEGSCDVPCCPWRLGH